MQKPRCCAQQFVMWPFHWPRCYHLAGAGCSQNTGQKLQMSRPQCIFLHRYSMLVCQCGTDTHHLIAHKLVASAPTCWPTGTQCIVEGLVTPHNISSAIVIKRVCLLLTN